MAVSTCAPKLNDLKQQGPPLKELAARLRDESIQTGGFCYPLPIRIDTGSNTYYPVALIYYSTTGLSTTYLAIDEADKLAVIKISNTRRHDQLIETEYKALRRLNPKRHPNIIRASDDIFNGPRQPVFQGDCPLVILQYVEGLTMDQCDLTLHAKIKASAQVCDAMQCAHETGIAHCDGKPDNVMIRNLVTPEHAEPVLIDFGLSQVVEREGGVLVFMGEPRGHPFYIAPEMDGCRESDHRVDIFSFGVVLFEIATGDHPRNMSLIRSYGLPNQLVDIIVKSTQNDPNLRFRTAREMQEALGQVLKFEFHDSSVLDGMR